MEHKTNTFTDFVAAATTWSRAGWTTADRLAARGGSAGGLLMGAVANLRPDLWRAVVAEVPFVDVVTTMSDPSLPLTVTEWEEWGDPVHDPAAYERMLGYSPYDNVEGRSRYPGHVRDRRPQRSQGGLLGAGQVGGQAARRGSRRRPTVRCCCAPRWAPATGAPPVATTPGGTRPGYRRSCCGSSGSGRRRAARREPTSGGLVRLIAIVQVDHLGMLSVSAASKHRSDLLADQLVPVEQRVAQRRHQVRTGSTAGRGPRRGHGRGCASTRARQASSLRTLATMLGPPGAAHRVEGDQRSRPCRSCRPSGRPPRWPPAGRRPPRCWSHRRTAPRPPSRPWRSGSAPRSRRCVRVHRSSVSRVGQQARARPCA